jgi:hypothetical protein
MTDENVYANERVKAALLGQGIILKKEVPDPSVAEAVVLVGEAMFYHCLEEFRELVKEVFSGCQLSDLLASDEEMRSYIGEGWKPKGLYVRSDHPAVPQNAKSPACSDCPKEAGRK